MARRKRWVFSITIVACLAVPALQGQGSAPQIGQALVVGNAKYFFGTIPNAVDDADAVAKTLERIHYKVTLLRDADFVSLDAAVKSFGAGIKGTSDIAVVYFAGHAVQVSGENYLIPGDAQAMTPSELPGKTEGLQSIFNVMRHHLGPNLVIVDACRSNPFGSPSGNDFVPGLSRPFNPPPNSMIMFSTGPGSVTVDGEGHHSPFTRALLKYIPQPGQLTDQLFQKVYADVQDNTDGLQMPSETVSIPAPFALRQPLYLVLQLSSGDDDVVVLINNREVLDWNRDGTTTRKVALEEGTNNLEVKVYNQRSYTGGLPLIGGHLPEGWNYALSVSDANGHLLTPLSGREDVPTDNGPHHGKLFTAATMKLAVNPDSDDITIVAVDPAVWTRDH
jgi:hypothetical protein